MRQVFVNRSLERRHAGKGATPEARAGDLREPAFHQIQPGAAGRHKVKVHARVAGQPPPHVRTLVGTQVIQDQMQRLVGRRGRAVPHVVMGLAFGNARAQRQHGAGAVQRLNPTLLIDAKHHGFGGRIHIQAHHVAQFFDNVGVRRQFEAPDPMGLEPVLTPNLPNRAVAHALRFRQAATTPMGARGRPRGQGRIDDGLHFRRTELLPSARPRGLTEHPRHPVGDKPQCPQTHGHPTDVQRPRDGRGRFMVRQHPHQPRPTRNLLGRRPLAGHPANWACSVGDAKTQYR